MICDMCHKDKPDVETRIDPYSREIYDEIIERDLCEQCYEDRIDSI